ncbi:hypothetical protein BC834DRAFT_561626 [Gloeopeniophorella convolvens]|nr:hypothetical protein BC834DRAFT_561626 [Gloeopeniophorella convolvens]
MSCVSSAEHHEPEYAVEECAFALCIISENSELRPEGQPERVHETAGGCKVLITFAGAPDQEYQLFIRNYGVLEASADVSIGEKHLGKWLVAREPKAWHNIGCGNVLKFPSLQEDHSEHTQATRVEIRFHYLFQLPREAERLGFAPVIVAEPTPNDGPGYMSPNNHLMQSKFEVVHETPLLTFVISFKPPPVNDTGDTASKERAASAAYAETLAEPSSLPESSDANALSNAQPLRPQSPTNSDTVSYHTAPDETSTSSAVSTLFTAPSGSTPPSTSIYVSAPSIVSSASSTVVEATRTRPISEMSSKDIEEVLSEYKDTDSLLPASILPRGPDGKESVRSFCSFYHLPETDILPVLERMAINNRYGLLRLRVGKLREKGMKNEHINMLRLAVIRWAAGGDSS